jgi:hypothetical protein
MIIKTILHCKVLEKLNESGLVRRNHTKQFKGKL